MKSPGLLSSGSTASLLGSVHPLADEGARSTVSEEQALIALTRSVAENAADDADSVCLLGAKAMRQGAYQEAIACFSNAIRVRSDHALAFHLLGRCFRRLGQTSSALTSHRRATELDPNNADYWAALGGILHFCGQSAEAIEAFHTAYLQSDKAACLIRAMTLIPLVYDSVQQIEKTRAVLNQAIEAARAMNLSMESPLDEGLHLFYLPYHGLNDRPILEAMADLVTSSCKDASYIAPHLKRREHRRYRKGKRRLRLALVSRHFRRHTIGNLFVGLVEKFPRDDFEVLVFSVGNDSDEMVERFRKGGDRFISLEEDLNAARREIGKRKPDIILYPDIGMEKFTYGLAFSRLAPVQCATWGHPVTTGIPTVDYFLSAKDLEPSGSEDSYSEELIQLDRVGCYYERPEVNILPHHRGDFGLPEDLPLYVCPQSIMKLHPDFDDVLDAILRRDEKGVVVMLRPWSEAIAQAFSTRLKIRLGPRMERVHCLQPMPRADFLALLSLSDVMLDPLYFGGGNTNYEACHVGLPIVTLPGQFMRGRFAYALYRQMGIDEPIAADLSDYVEKAVEIANDPEKRTSLESLILSRNDSVFEDRESLDELATRFTEMIYLAQSDPTSGFKGTSRI